MRSLANQRGSVLATATVVLAGLVIVAGFTVISVQRGVGVSGQQREHAQALHAAEAGVAAAASYLHTRLTPTWTAYVALPDGGGNPVGVSPPDINGNGAPPGGSGNSFGSAADTWYEVTLYNNKSDPGFAIAEDQDKIILIRSIGHGPANARVVLEVEIEGTVSGAAVKRRAWREIL